MRVCLGNLQFQQGAFADALQSFKRASEVRPQDTDILVRLANSASRCRETELFEKTLEWALELNPTHPEVLRLSIYHSLEQGRFARGAELCCALIRTNPDDLLLLLQLGKCLRELNDVGSAQWCYERALEIDPSCDIARQALERLRHPQIASGNSAAHLQSQNPVVLTNP
jgi:cytochrome c-type biogenesis protein CcmH/NrfG